MQKNVHSPKAWLQGFRGSRLSAAARLDVAFWAAVAGGLFFLFHMHGNSQEIATCRHSLFLWLRSRWIGDFAYGMFLPLASLAAIWMRRRDVAAATKSPNPWGIPAVSAGLLNGFGLQVQRVGSGLFSAAGNPFAFNVAPECSGLRSLLAMTALMGFYAWYSQKTLPKKWFLFLCSVPVAVVANVFRIVLVVVVAAFFGQEKAIGLWHDYSGYPIFLIGIALMLLLDRLLNGNYRAAWTKLKKHFLASASS